MAENKKSFLLYTDIYHTVKKLSDEKAGQLFKHILSYVNDENPETSDFIIEITFEPIKQSLKRDLRKYEAIRDRNKKNGSLGGRPKNPDEPRKPSGLLKTQTNPENPDEPRKADSVIVSDIVSDNDKKKKRKKKASAFVAPALDEVKAFFIEKGYDPAIGIKAWMGYDAANWHDSKGKPVLNWKQKMINVWFRDEHKINGAKIIKSIMP